MFNLGAKPHPIRKRAWHRALKRGYLWLILPYCASDKVKENEFTGNKFSQVHFDRDCPNNQGYITWPFI